MRFGVFWLWVGFVVLVGLAFAAAAVGFRGGGGVGGSWCECYRRWQW